MRDINVIIKYIQACLRDMLKMSADKTSIARKYDTNYSNKMVRVALQLFSTMRRYRNYWSHNRIGYSNRKKNFLQTMQIFSYSMNLLSLIESWPFIMPRPKFKISMRQINIQYE